MTFASVLATMRPQTSDPEALGELARLALQEGEEDAALRIVAPAAERLRNARLWQWTALLHRALDEHDRALEAFEAAGQRDPGDASIAHGHARVALEAGLDARALFARALRLGASADVILGHIAARYAMGDGEAAAADLAAILDRNPLWSQGHIQWAQLSSMIGRPGEATATVDRALAVHPDQAGLWQAAIHILVSAERHAEARARADRAIGATGDRSAFALARAAALSDSGENDEAERAFAQLGNPADIGHAIRLARHLIRLESWDRLAPLADRWMGGDDAHVFWPYASIVWRKVADPRWAWLEGDDRLVQVHDLSDALPSLERLRVVLRALHARSGRFLDQSVRGGTQTDGPLLSRLDPEIRALRRAIERAVDAYRASLPPIDPRHPMLRHRRDRRIRFAGSWSVRLVDAGSHSHHVHPQGWISSAFYVSVPPGLSGDEGTLVLGQPQAELGVKVEPVRRVVPKAATLVLFPSIMWHGTLPFRDGERMTVAFDVAPPH